MSDIAKNMVDSRVRANGEAKRYVLCMKWGTKYGADYVNRLYGMVKRHLTLDFTMVCLTDDSRGIDQAVRCYPLPALNLPPNLPERGGINLPRSRQRCMTCQVRRCFWI